MPAHAPDGDRVALVLAAAGVRGAYELGVVAALLPELERRGHDVTVVCGAGAGAINAVLLGSLLDLPARAQAELADERWRTLARSVAAPRAPAVAINLARLAGDALGVPGVRGDGVLDSRPLRRFLERHLDWDALHRNVDGGLLDAAAVVATRLRDGRPVAFVDGIVPPAGDGAGTAHVPARLGAEHVAAADGIVPPADTGAGTAHVPARLGAEHVAAAAAIPLVYPAVEVTEPQRARGRYADGAMRPALSLPPVLELGADRVLAVACGRPHAVLSAAHGAIDGPPCTVVTPPAGRCFDALAAEALHRHCGGLRAARHPEAALAGRLLYGRDLLSLLLLAPEHIDALLDAGRADGARWLRSHPAIWDEARPRGAPPSTVPEADAGTSPPTAVSLEAARRRRKVRRTTRMPAQA